MENTLKEDIKKLYEVLIAIDNEKDCANLMEDLCTYREIQSMAQRLKAAELLAKGETYETIIKQTDISSATLSRVSKCLKYGKGYKKFVK